MANPKCQLQVEIKGIPRLLQYRIVAPLLVLAALVGVVWAQVYPPIYKDSDGARMVVTSAGSLENYQGAGTIAGHPTVTTTGLTLAEYGDHALHRTIWTFDDVSLHFTDSGANGGHASLKLYEGPAGWLYVMGASLDLDVECNSSGIADTATYDFAVGTAATGTDNAALATTEQDIIAVQQGDLDGTGTNNAALGAVTTNGFALDGHTTAVDFYLNGAIEADDISADDTCTVSGTVSITWLNLGDY